MIAPAAANEVLRVEDLEVGFDLPAGYVAAVQQIGFGLRRGETLAIVGESGCGKSVLAYSLLGLRKSGTARIARGRVELNGIDLLALPPEQLRQRRSRDISMVFQEPASSLNPVMSVGEQIAETILAHEAVAPRGIDGRCIALLREVGIPEPERRLGQYPHELSGGMRQRVVIAIALACRPQVLVADEPTTALDVTIQAQVLDLLDSLKREYGLGVLLVTHNLGVVAGWAQRVMVMYAGRIVETGSVGDILQAPAHPYTRALLRSLPHASLEKFGSRLEEIAGTVPALDGMPAGCRFCDRCPEVEPICLQSAPPLEAFAAARSVACWKAGVR